uniref:8 kDa Amblyomma family member n=1 Tax=Rhipicephalus zambeziensis TaxID=60191 RepID=A0A224Y129_9ACAR
MPGFMALTIVMFTVTLIKANMGARVTPRHKKIDLTTKCSARQICTVDTAGVSVGCSSGCRCSVSSNSRNRNRRTGFCTANNFY